MATAKDKTYPVIRPLYYYYITSVEKAVKPFIDYNLSTEGQKTVEEIGYVPLTK
jgi:phosphate transport system substrate-binding protein